MIDKLQQLVRLEEELHNEVLMVLSDEGSIPHDKLVIYYRLHQHLGNQKRFYKESLERLSEMKSK